jgi:uncharacterized membrane protein
MEWNTSPLTNPSDARALTFLRSLEGPEVVVEAEGGDYGYFSRMSTFTGIPTTIGWPYHEITWRAEGSEIMKRVTDVQTIYEDPTQATTLLQKYNALTTWGVFFNEEVNNYNIILLNSIKKRMEQG